MKHSRRLLPRINASRNSGTCHLDFTLAAAAFALGCSVQRSELVTAPPSNATGGNGSALTELLADAATANGQPVDGSNIQLPSRSSGHTYQVQVPASALGDPAATYEYSLEATPSGVSAKVKAAAGAGHLF